jgi:hypothetical protein
MKRFLFALAGVVALIAVPAPGRAARVEADPNKEYPIGPEAGPYAICVKAYRSEVARAQANELCLYLRQQGWPAYVFDYTAEEARQAKEWVEQRYKDVPPEARPHRTIHVIPQCGVLIGGYRDFDSASGDIAKVKRTPEPPPSRVALDAGTIDPKTGQIFSLSAFAQCIATRNPTVPRQQRDAGAPDPTWKQLNDGRPYNLLKCGKPWTLMVRQFQGVCTIQPRTATDKFLDTIGLGSKAGTVLDAAALQAEEIARVLHEKPFNYDTYVLHTRTGSIVTVGAFDRMDDDRMRQIAEKLRNLQFGLARDAIKLTDQPLPMKVPRL